MKREDKEEEGTDTLPHDLVSADSVGTSAQEEESVSVSKESETTTEAMEHMPATTSLIEGDGEDGTALTNPTDVSASSATKITHEDQNEINTDNAVKSEAEDSQQKEQSGLGKTDDHNSDHVDQGSTTGDGIEEEADAVVGMKVDMMPHSLHEAATPASEAISKQEMELDYQSIEQHNGEAEGEERSSSMDLTTNPSIVIPNTTAATISAKISGDTLSSTIQAGGNVPQPSTPMAGEKREQIVRMVSPEEEVLLAKRVFRLPPRLKSVVHKHSPNTLVCLSLHFFNKQLWEGRWGKMK